VELGDKDKRLRWCLAPAKCPGSGWETKQKLMLTDTTKYGNCRSIGAIAGDAWAISG
jgi:hypothetical protein